MQYLCEPGIFASHPCSTASFACSFALQGQEAQQACERWRALQIHMHGVNTQKEYSVTQLQAVSSLPKGLYAECTATGGLTILCPMLHVYCMCTQPGMALMLNRYAIMYACRMHGHLHMKLPCAHAVCMHKLRCGVTHHACPQQRCRGG
jgi:hypothetical protein